MDSPKSALLKHFTGSRSHNTAEMMEKNILKKKKKRGKKEKEFSIKYHNVGEEQKWSVFQQCRFVIEIIRLFGIMPSKTKSPKSLGENITLF